MRIDELKDEQSSDRKASDERPEQPKIKNRFVDQSNEEATPYLQLAVDEKVKTSLRFTIRVPLPNDESLHHA